MNGWDGSGHCCAQGVFDFGEELFDGIEIGAVRRQEEYPGTGLADPLADRHAFVAAEIIENDDIAGFEGSDQFGLDIGLEGVAIDRAIEHPWRLDPVVTQGSDERHGLPVPIRRMSHQGGTAYAPAAQRRHVGLHPGFIDEDQACGIDPALVTPPLFAAADKVRPVLFSRKNGFF